MGAQPGHAKHHPSILCLMSVLVTGAAGFIGSHVAESLLKSGEEVVALDDLSGGFEENIPAGAKSYIGSILDTALLGKIFQEHRFTHVYHLAAYAAEGLSHFIRSYNYTNNVVGSMCLINEAIKHEVQTFVFTSSIAVYGAGQTPMREEMNPMPEDPYGIAKFAVELDLKAAHEMFGLDYIIFRPHNVYGERQNIADKYRNVIGIFMNQAMRGEPMSVFGDGLQTRAFSHVDDVAPLIARSPHVAGARNQVFNIGADTPYTILELAREIAEAFGTTPEVRHLPARNEVVHAFSDHAKVRDIFAPPAPIDLHSGIKRMAEWTRHHGPMEPVEFRAIEITRNLPPSWLPR
jgi:UDP-glucose 4-epimerase